MSLIGNTMKIVLVTIVVKQQLMLFNFFLIQIELKPLTENEKDETI